MLKKVLDKYNQFPIQVKASFWFVICAFLQKGISVITTPIFTRLMSTSEYGQYSVFVSWMEILTVIVSLKLYAGVFMQGVVKFEEERNKYVASMQGLCISLVLVWSIIYIIFQDFFNKLFSLSSIQMFAMLSLIWTTAVFQFWSIQQRIDNKYKKLVSITMIVSILKPVLGIFLVLNTSDKVSARVIGLAAVELAAYFWMFIGDIVKGNTFFNKKYWTYALQLNIPLIPHYLSMSVLSSSDRIMIQKMFGESEAGVYSLAYSLALMMTLFNTALLQTVEPWIFKKINAKQSNEIGNIAYTTLIIIAVVNTLLIAFAPEAVRLFAPIEYHEAIWIIPPVAMSVYFMYMYSLFATFEFYYEKTKYITMATVVSSITNIILNYIFLQWFGYYAAGYTTLLCYIISALMHFYFMNKICKEKLKGEKPYNAKILILITLGFMSLGLLFLFSYFNDYLRYALLVMIGIIIFVKRKLIKHAVDLLIAVKKK